MEEVKIMANSKGPVVNYAAMSRSEFQSVLAGGNLDKPLYEFDANGNPIYHEENLPYFTPSTIVKHPVTGRDTTATHLLNYIKNQEQNQKAVEAMYDNLLQYNHAYNVNAKTIQAGKAVGTFITEAALTAGETVTNIANAVQSTGRTMMEKRWETSLEKTSEVTRKEVLGILDSFGDENTAKAYVKYHNFEKDNTVSDDAKKLFTEYRILLNAREKDEMWNNVLQKTWEGARETADKIHGDYQGNKYQNIGNIAKFSGNIAGSWGVFKAAGIATNVLAKTAATAAQATRISKLAAAATKAYGVSGKTAVFGTAFLNQFDSLRRQGLAAGLSYDDALNLAMLGGMAEAFVEGWGVSKFGRLSAKKSIFNILKSETIPEAVEEMTQTFAENVLTKAYGINSSTLTDIAEEIILSGLGGGIAGSAVGVVDYFNGQSRLRIAALKQEEQRARQEAFEEAKQKNKVLIEENKAKSEAAKQAVQEAQENTQVAQAEEQKVEEEVQKPVTEKEQENIQKELENAFFSSVDRLLQENDPEYVKKLQKIQEDFDKGLREILTEKLKKVNPKITDEQVDNAVALLTRVAKRLNNDDVYSDAVESWANEIVKWSNEKAPQYEKNLADLDERFGIDSLGLTTQDITDLKSGNRITRHQAEWKVVKGNLQLDFNKAGVSDKMAGELANTFEKIFQNTALISNISPLVLYEKLAPKIVGLNRASFNKQSIAGYEGSILDNIPESLKETAEELRSESENLIDTLADDSNTKESKKAKELALSELTRDLENKQNATPEDFLQALETRARMEKLLADDMGISYGNNIDFDDYKTIALMRIRGAAQSDINEAYQVAERSDKNGYKIDEDKVFEESKQKLFPRLSDEEVKQISKIFQRAKESGKQLKGYFQQESENKIIEQSEKDLEQAENVGGTVVLGESDTIDNVAAEEFFHSISTKLHEAAKIQAIKDSGKKFFFAFDSYTMGLLPDVKPLARLFRELTAPINGIEMTEREMHETIATAFVNHLNLELMPESQKEAFNMYEAENNDFLSVADDSKYKSLSNEQKQALGQRFANLCNQGASAELISAGNAILGAATQFDIEQGKKLAADVLDKFAVYNDALWANNLEKIDTMEPALQVDFLSNFAENIVNQGYDLLVADQYDTEFSPEQSQVLVRSAYRDNSLFTEDSRESVYYHTQALPLSERMAKYKPTGEWLEKAKSFAKKALNLKTMWQDYVETLSASAFKADPIIGSTLRRAMFEHGGEEIRLQKLASEIPLLVAKNKDKLTFTKEEFDKNFKDILNLGNKNARQKAKNWLVKQFAGTEDADAVAKAMDAIYAELDKKYVELSSLGVPVKHLKEYFPRYVQDIKGLSEYLGYDAPKGAMQRRIDTMMVRFKQRFPNKSDNEIRRMIVDRINSQWHKFSGGEEVAAFHERGNYYSADTREYYDDPFECLARYFESANRTILMRKLTGRLIRGSKVGDKVTRFEKEFAAYRGSDFARFDSSKTGQLGKAVALAISKGNPNWDAMDNFARQMKKFVNRTTLQQNEFVRTWLRTNAMLLGNVFSATNQIMELAITTRNFGLEVTNDAIQEAITEILKDAEGTIGANLENVHVQALQELIRYRDNDMLAKLTDFFHTVSGFKGADILLKNIEAKAVMKNAQKVLMSGEDTEKMRRFIRDFNRTFPPEMYSEKTRNQIKQDLREGNLTENVKFFIFNYISDIQPINSAEVPNGVNSAGSVAKLVYQYRTTPLRQLEYIANDVIEGFRYANSLTDAKERKLAMKDAVKNLIAYFLYMSAFGIPVGVLQALLRGKKPNMLESGIYSPLQILQINEYTVASIKQRGLFKGFASELAPSFRVADDVVKDTFRLISGKDYHGNTVKDVPVFGPLMYYWLLGGREYAKRHGEAIGYDPDDNEKYYNARRAVGGK